MRYAIISDVHGNVGALKAVLKSISGENVDRYLSLGDIVGYGADPGECMSIVKSLKPEILISGNHDWGACGLLKLDYFNEYAREAIGWTKDALNKMDLAYIASFKLVFSNNTMTMVHGSLEAPASFGYIFDAEDALATFKLMGTELCFVGHSHVPGIFCYKGGKVYRSKFSKIKMRDDCKYIVNAGSVGQPRDRDNRASYVVYDDIIKSVEIKRAEYDIRSAQNKIIKAGLPKFLADRLAEGM